MFKFSQKLLNQVPTFEDQIYNYNLNYICKFNAASIFAIKNCNKISLNFGFKDIRFDKKQMIFFFLILELLTNQKCVITNSRKNLIAFKIKKGSVAGCKVTLQQEQLFIFLDLLLLGLPRSEIFKGFFFKKEMNESLNFSTKLSELFVFYSLESEMVHTIKNVDIVFNFNTLNNFEKQFFFTFNKLPLQVT